MSRIRKANLQDSKQILDLLYRLDLETNFMLFEPGERTTSEEEIKKKIEESIIFLAETQNNIVGFLELTIAKEKKIKHSAYVVIGILKDFRGKGIGKLLFEELDKWAISNNILRLELTVMVENKNALELYKKFGFKIEGLREKSCLLNGVLIDEYYMGKVFV